MSASVQNDVSTLSDWWAARAHSVGPEVRGLWFGIADLAVENGGIRRTMYVGGTPRFDPNDGGDWASDYVWMPSDRYVSLAGLAAFEDSQWRDALAHAVEVVSLTQPWVSGPINLRGVGVGFDGGDVHIVWTSA